MGMLEKAKLNYHLYQKMHVSSEISRCTFDIRYADKDDLPVMVEPIKQITSSLYLTADS